MQQEGVQCFGTHHQEERRCIVSWLLKRLLFSQNGHLPCQDCAQTGHNGPQPSSRFQIPQKVPVQNLDMKLQPIMTN